MQTAHMGRRWPGSRRCGSLGASLAAMAVGEVGDGAGLGMAAAAWRFGGSLGFWKGILLRKGFECRKMQGLADDLSSADARN